MNLRIQLSFLALMLLGSLWVVSAQVECYSCSYTYRDEETESDNSNCKTPTQADTSTTTCPTTSSCYVGSSISSSSSVVSPGTITYRRGCMDSDDCVTDCRKDPRDCWKCCTGERCNTATLQSHLSDNALTNTCHRCQYSEVPGTRSDTGCAQGSFDASSAQVYSVECPGLCYSATARFDGVQDIIRGCLYHGNQCSYDKLVYSGIPASVVDGRDDVKYDLSCCIGDNCNTATALSVGLVAVLLSPVLSLIVVYM
eukprot:XP_003725663.1 PREDICTED: uncharacterized protein LOC100893035 [Strongylocentrotus purpuratus]